MCCIGTGSLGCFNFKSISDLLESFGGTGDYFCSSFLGASSSAFLALSSTFLRSNAA
jgi:hypothetical protein